MGYKDKEAEKKAAAERAKRYRVKKKTVTPCENVTPLAVTPTKTVTPSVTPSEVYKEARYRAYKEGHLHGFRG